MFQITLDSNTSPRDLRAAAHLIQALLGAPAVVAEPTIPGLAAAKQALADFPLPPPVPLPAPPPQGGWQGTPVQFGGAAAPAPLPAPAPSFAGVDQSLTAPGGLPAPGAPGQAEWSLSVPSFAQMGAAPAAAPTPSPAGPVKVDISGLPWDARIHSSSKIVLADLRWKKKKNLNDAAYVGRIETELRNLMAQPVPPGMPAPVPVAPPAPVPAPVPVAPPAPVGSPQSYEELIPVLTAQFRDNPALMARLAPTLAHMQIPQLPMLAQRPDLIPAFWAMLTSA